MDAPFIHLFIPFILNKTKKHNNLRILIYKWITSTYSLASNTVSLSFTSSGVVSAGLTLVIYLSAILESPWYNNALIIRLCCHLENSARTIGSNIKLNASYKVHDKAGKIIHYNAYNSIECFFLFLGQEKILVSATRTNPIFPRMTIECFDKIKHSKVLFNSISWYLD